MEFCLKVEVPAEKCNIFIFRRLGCGKDSLLFNEKSKINKKKWRICFVLSVVLHGHFAIPSSRCMSSHSKSHKILVDVDYSVCYYELLINSTKDLWAVCKTVNVRGNRHMKNIIHI